MQKQAKPQTVPRLGLEKEQEKQNHIDMISINDLTEDSNNVNPSVPEGQSSLII